jgi:hypothetical protein
LQAELAFLRDLDLQPELIPNPVRAATLRRRAVMLVLAALGKSARSPI